MPNILITTFGATWQIVPELLGFANPGLVDLYALHPAADRIREARARAGICPVEELWLITTKGKTTDEAVLKVREWQGLLGRKPQPEIRVWQANNVQDLVSEAECRLMAECIYRLVLHASERVKRGQLIVSLTGGRKTMSSDIQNAAVAFGCHALVHVIQNERHRRSLLGLSPDDFTRPLPADLRDAVTPVVTGSYRTSPVVDEVADGPLQGAAYPVPFSEACDPLEINVKRPELVLEVQRRQDNAGFLYCNYTNRLMHEEADANFLALYSLPPAVIRDLKARRLGMDPQREEAELAWIRKLPKTELHCHLGGVADARELVEIAAANRRAMAPYAGRLAPWLDRWRRKLDRGQGLPIRFKNLRKAVPGVPEPFCVAAFVLLFEDRPEFLDEVVFGPYLDASAFCGIGFKPYEALGDLQGSGLLQSEESLRAACRVLMRRAALHNIRCIEVRCSPVNYTRGGLDPFQVAQIIHEELTGRQHCTCSIIFTASRHHNMARVRQHIRLARSLMAGDGPGFPNLAGFDLAGNETAGSAARMRKAFMPMMEKCMHFTIHAGEIQDVGSIWEAVYHLSAERIGHGLTLRDNPGLLERFRDRSIALEMCPSSNFQIVGFRDNYLPASQGRPLYPLKEYLDQGLRVTVNTDNPGISRTDFSRELHRAARLTPGGLSIWDLLLLIRNGYKAGFCKRPVRTKLLREAESEILELIQGALP